MVALIDYYGAKMVLRENDIIRGLAMPDDYNKMRLIDSLRKAVLALRARAVRTDARLDAIESSQLTTSRQYEVINDKLNELLGHRNREDAVKELTEKDQMKLKKDVSMLMEDHIERRGAKRFKEWLPVAITAILGSLAIIDRLTGG